MMFSHYDSPLGGITLFSDGKVLTGLYFDDQKYFPDLKDEEKDLPVFAETKRWLDIFFSGRDPGFLPEIRMNGTDFQKEVWDILLKIGYGKTMSYGQIADQIGKQRGKKMSAQAVGTAVGRNPVSLIVPCHRVLGSDGSMTGYAAGIDKKEALLRMEKEGLKG